MNVHVPPRMCASTYSDITRVSFMLRRAGIKGIFLTSRVLSVVLVSPCTAVSYWVITCTASHTNPRSYIINGLEDPRWLNRAGQSPPTLKNSWKVSPMAVSGMANSVFSVATRNLPCTDRPTPCRQGGGGGVRTLALGREVKVRKLMGEIGCLSLLQRCLCVCV